MTDAPGTTTSPYKAILFSNLNDAIVLQISRKKDSGLIFTLSLRKIAIAMVTAEINEMFRWGETSVMPFLTMCFACYNTGQDFELQIRH